jgi:hypothetical protein
MERLPVERAVPTATLRTTITVRICLLNCSIVVRLSSLRVVDTRLLTFSMRVCYEVIEPESDYPQKGKVV